MSRQKTQLLKTVAVVWTSRPTRHGHIYYYKISLWSDVKILDAGVTLYDWLNVAH